MKLSFGSILSLLENNQLIHQKYGNDPNILIHFSNTPQVNFKDDQYGYHSTPAGIFLYCLGNKSNQNFATDRPYIHVFKIKNENGIVRFPDKIPDIKGALEELTKQVPAKALERIQSNLYVKHPFALFYKLTEYLSSTMDDEGFRNSNPQAWRSLLMNYGIKGIIDNYGIIYPGENNQAVIFDGSVLQMLEVIENV